jgi:hypothetical protein
MVWRSAEGAWRSGVLGRSGSGRTTNPSVQAVPGQPIAPEPVLAQAGNRFPIQNWKALGHIRWSAQPPQSGRRA